MSDGLLPRPPPPPRYRWARRIVVAVVGGTVLAIGIALIVLPGPALAVIPLGLAILGVEFAWARYWLRKVRERSTTLLDLVRNNRRGRVG